MLYQDGFKNHYGGRLMYQYTYRLCNGEYWRLSMYYTYGSMVGVCNLIFTAALFILTYVKWGGAGWGYRAMLILGCSLFTVLQPLAIWRRSKKSASAIKEDTHIMIDGKGIHVTVGTAHTDIVWDKIRRISKKPDMLVIFSDTTHGYVLTDRVLGGDREAVYSFITARMNHGKK